ncbi:unnamed protein product [Echinostoma caproni]|uniref:tRNA (guanine(26)-N(2))-dimethyltransferase n=1 Tax=Echinostoma caproni TaxID=27848 RepID=A0A183BCK1_9TREM|nr:unnamed protein product [Echinostoma caproni]
MYRQGRGAVRLVSRVFWVGLSPSLGCCYKMGEVASNSLPCNTAREGKANVLLPVGVFYNRVQQFNRDITVAVIKHFQLLHQYEWVQRVKKKIGDGKSEVSPVYQGLHILEALSASGIRSVRFALEVPRVKKIIANDLDQKAAQLIAENLTRNEVEGHADVTLHIFVYAHMLCITHFIRLTADVIPVRRLHSAVFRRNIALAFSHNGKLKSLTRPAITPLRVILRNSRNGPCYFYLELLI